MYSENLIRLPYLFNPLKHHLGFIKDYIEEKAGKNADIIPIIKDLRHLGGSLMDVYTGPLTPEEIIEEIDEFLKTNYLTEFEDFVKWAGINPTEFKSVILSDDSHWVLKYFENEVRFVHSFPARFSPHSFRVKANTLKSAILYLIIVGKDFITEDDLNFARAEAGLSPIKDVVDTEAITEMIEILRVV
jgi:hypothetical protein